MYTTICRDLVYILYTLTMSVLSEYNIEQNTGNSASKHIGWLVYISSTT